MRCTPGAFPGYVWVARRGRFPGYDRGAVLEVRHLAQPGGTGNLVRWVPAVDTTIVVLAWLSLVRVLARTWIRRRRPHGRP
jgi:hypothetical protein